MVGYAGYYLLLVAAAVSWHIYCERIHATFQIQFGWFFVSIYCAVIAGRFEAHHGPAGWIPGAIIGYFFGQLSMVVFTVVLSVPVRAYYRWREKRRNP